MSRASFRSLAFKATSALSRADGVRLVAIDPSYPGPRTRVRYIDIGMGKVTCQISISLDGFVAGPNQSLENPIGEGGLRLHEWVFATASWREQEGQTGGERSVDSEVVDELFENVGAYIMGRKMFGGGDGAWDS